LFMLTLPWRARQVVVVEGFRTSSGKCQPRPRSATGECRSVGRPFCGLSQSLALECHARSRSQSGLPKTFIKSTCSYLGST
jgi:hypothetical protein